MLKSRTGDERALQRITWARTATAAELFTENRVLGPLALSKSTSKYGSSSVAAGVTSTLHMVARAGTTGTIRHASARPTRSFISLLLPVLPPAEVTRGIVDR